MAISQLYPNTRPTLNLNFARSKTLDPHITFTRNSTATYVGSDGLIKTAAAGEARFDHNGNGDSLGLLIEESRTNVELNSATLGSWTRVALTEATNNQVAPDGTTTASTFTVTATNTSHHLTRTWQNGGGSPPYPRPAYSFFVKPGTQKKFVFIDGDNPNLSTPGSQQKRVAVDFDTGTITGFSTNPLFGLRYSYEHVGSGWYRVKVALSSSAFQFHVVYILPYDTLPADFSDTNTVLPITDFDFAGSGETFALWGVQTELPRTYEAFVTSYIPTSGSTVTRLADTAQITGTNFSSWWNPSDWSIVADVTGYTALNTQTNSGTGFPYVFSLHQSTSNRLIGARSAHQSAGGNNGAFAIYSQSPGAFAYATNVNFNTMNYRHKVGASYNNSVYTSFADGVTGGSLTPGANTSLFTNLTIGHGTDGGYWGGYISRLVYYPYRLTDSQLEELTL